MRWTEALINRLDSVIASFNPNLKKLEDDLKKQVKIVERKNNQKKFIESALAQINQLIRFEEV
jgi:transcription antitermination factor NusA-like protein